MITSISKRAVKCTVLDGRQSVDHKGARREWQFHLPCKLAIVRDHPSAAILYLRTSRRHRWCRSDAEYPRCVAFALLDKLIERYDDERDA